MFATQDCRYGSTPPVEAAGGLLSTEARAMATRSAVRARRSPTAWIRSLIVRALLAAALTTLVPSAATAQVPDGTLVVANKSAATATFLDLASNRILATLPTRSGPHEITLTTDGRTAVVTDYGANGRTLTVLDVEGRRVARTIDLGAYTAPHGIAFLPGDSLVAVTSEASSNVVIVHPEMGTVRRAIATGAGGSHMLTFDRSGERIYTGNIASNTVSELDAETGALLRTFDVPPQPEAIGMPAGGGEVWVGSNATGVVSAIDLATGAVRTVADGFGWPYRIVFTPDDTTVLLPDARRQELRILERATARELARLPFPGAGPQGITISPDGRHAFLSLSREARVAVIDLVSRRVIGRVDAGPAPDGIVFLRPR
jgi:DNA-binding beta-propeller fold protein YncE